MKRLFALLLSLCLLMGLIASALAEPAVADVAAPALPRLGDVVHGFEAVELRDYPLLDAVIVRFEHQKTGAALFYIANDDVNRAFDLSFFTEAIDQTGLPHVFEHATIQGSEKYPGEQMFFNLNYQTYNTYMNAMTSQWFTTYPIASLSEAQLLKLADFYTDACFYPTIMENERIFRTEAWRYRMEDPEDDLTLEGTVYTEMLGSLDQHATAGYTLYRAAFPGSLAGNVSGGDPDHIPEMTWEALKDYHDRYYHPSNSVAYLYGQFDDYAAFLELLDSYYSGFERRDFDFRADAGYAPIDGPVSETVAFPVEQGSNTERASDVYYAVVCPGLREQREQEAVLNTMTDLLGFDASPLMRRLEDALPYGSFGVGMSAEGPEDAVLFAARNVDPEDAETFKALVDEALSDVAENGFDQDMADSAAASLAISARLIREDSDPVGLIQQMLTLYAGTGDPWRFLDYQDALFNVDAWNADGVYARAAADWLAGNDRTALVTVYPEPGAKEAKAAALAEQLADAKADMTADEIAAIVEATNADAPEDRSAEYVAQLKAVTVASLPEELTTYDVTDVTGEDGIRHIDAVAAVDGISQANVLLDIAGLEQEDLHWFSLYMDLIGELDTAGHTKAELSTLWSRYLYGGAIHLSLPSNDAGDYHPYLRMQWVALDDDLAAGYDLMRELVYDTKVDDPDELLEQVQSLRASFRSGVSADPQGLLMRRALARTLPICAYNSYVNDLDYYEFLGGVEDMLADDPAAAVEKLQAIQKALNNRANAVTMCAGNKKSIALNRELADKFLASLDEREIVPARYDFPVPARSEALIIDSGVQFNLLIGDLDAAGLEEYEGGLAAVSNLVTDAFLVPLLRDQYGVYTPYCQADDLYVYIYAYRDPNVAETFEVLDQLPAQIADMDLDQDTLDGYIMNAYSGYAMPEGALSGAATALLYALQDRDPAKPLEWMRQLKALTPEAVRDAAKIFENLSANGARMTAGAASAIDADAELFDAVLNPFGAVDRSQIDLDDAPEGSEHYDAVRFAFEQGLMDPATDTAFGVDAPATNGDVLAALYVLIGGPCDPDEALDTFAGYGLAAADTDLSAPAAPDDLWALMSALAGQDVGPLVSPANPEALTRAELAEALLAFAG